MATQLELSEKSTKLLEEIKKLSKQANKLTGATTGRGLTQFKFFGDKVEKFNEYRDNTAKVFNFLTNKAKQDEEVIAAMRGITVKQLRADIKAKQQFDILKERFEKQIELDTEAGGQLGEYFNNLNKDQQKLINGSETHQKELLQFFGKVQQLNTLNEDARTKLLAAKVEELVDTNEKQLKEQIETRQDALRDKSLEGEEETIGPLTLAQQKAKIEDSIDIKVDDSIADEVVGSSIGVMLGKFLSPGGGFFKAISRGLMMIPLGITKLFAFAFNPVGLAVIGGVLLFKFKDEISAFIGKAFNYLGGKINSLFESIGKFVDNILEGIRNYLSKIPIIGRFFKKEGEGTKEVPQVVSEEQIKREQGAMKTLLGGTPSETISQTPQQSMMNTITPNEIISQTGGQSFEQAEGRVQTLQKQLDEKIKRVDEISKNAIDKLITQGQPILTNLVNNAQNTANNITETVVKSVRNNDPLINLTRNYR